MAKELGLSKKEMNLKHVDDSKAQAKEILENMKGIMDNPQKFNIPGFLKDED